VSAVVDAGPASIAQTPASPDNFLYITVTVCQPGTTTCAKIDHVQVSTATTGLRVLASAVTGVTLTPESDPAKAGNTLAECYQLPQGTAWGDVVTADVEISGEKAAKVPVQVLSTPSATPSNANGACTDNGWLSTPQTLGANGVIGLGTLVQDCTSAQACQNQYYSCDPNNGNCQTNVSAAPPVASEVTNPVTMFATDKNGVIVQLPAVDPTKGAPSGLTGSIIFGIGTQANNALSGTTAALAADPNTGAISTTYTSQAAGAQPVKYTSWFDTGSVPYIFTDSDATALPLCAGNKGLADFYCPAQPLNLQATVTGAGGVGTGTVKFTVANAETLNSTNQTSIVFSSLGANSEPTGFGGANAFIWGLPFFLGRTVYIAYPGASVSGSGGTKLTGPGYAF
jgi:hypothetical protein